LAEEEQMIVDLNMIAQRTQREQGHFLSLVFALVRIASEEGLLILIKNLDLKRDY
jgi:hypothetical protein